MNTRLSTSWRLARVVILTAAPVAPACAGSGRPSRAPEQPRTDALLVLPGLGYNGSAEKTLGSLATAMRAEGVDLDVADYLTGSGLDDSRSSCSGSSATTGSSSISPCMSSRSLPAHGR